MSSTNQSFEVNRRNEGNFDPGMTTTDDRAELPWFHLSTLARKSAPGVQKRDVPFVALSALAISALVAFDLSQPANIAAIGIYAVPVLLAGCFVNARRTIVMAALASLGIVLGVVFAGINLSNWEEIANRSLALIPVWLAALLSTRMSKITEPASEVGFADVCERPEPQANSSDVKFRDFAAATPDLFWELDSDFRFTYLSESFESIFSQPREQALGRTTEETFADSFQAAKPAELERWHRHSRDLKAHRPFNNFVQRLVGQDGIARYLRNSGSPLFDSAGKFLGYRGIATDISQQVLMQQEAHRTNELLLKAIDSLHETFVLWDATDRFVICNNRFRLVNQAVSEVLRKGTRYEDFLRLGLARGCYPAAVGREESWIAERLEQHRNPTALIEVEREDGTWLLVDDQKMPDGGTVSIATDVTERKLAEKALRLSEAQYRVILENMKESFYRTDIEGRIVMASPSAKDLLGFEIDEVIGTELANLYVEPGKREDFLRALEESGGQVIGYEAALRHKDGRKIWVSTNSHFYYDEGGNVLGVEGTARDVTQRVLAEKALRASEARYRALIESGTVGVLVFDRCYRPLFVSSLAAGIYGYDSPEDIMAMDDLSLLLANGEPQRLAEVYERCEDRGERANVFELECRRKDGSAVWILQHATVVDWEADKAFLCTITDITKQKENEVEAERQSAVVTTLIDHLPAHVSMRDRDGRFVFVNKTMADDYGHEVSEFVGRKLNDIGRPITVPSVQTIADNVLRTGVPVRNLQFEPPRFPGRTFLTNVLPMRRDDGSVDGALAISLDVTERKQAEEALKASETRYAGILNIAPEAIITADDTLTVRVFNQGARSIFGYEEEEIVGKSIDLLIPGRFRAHHTQHVEAFRTSGVQSKRMSDRGEILALRKDGTEFPAEASISKLVLGKETLFNIILRDVSERKRIQNETLQAKELAEAASKAKSEFLANMSHELRTPLNAILGFSEIMTAESFGPLGNEQYREYAEDIYASGSHLLDLINDVLDLSKIEAGALKLADEIVDLNSALVSALRMVQGRADRKSLNIRTGVDSRLPSIRGDERAIKQILLNLLSNATKFTDGGGTISTVCELTADGGIRLVIADTGQGISSDEIQKVLEPFGQSGGAHMQAKEGVGLGLPFAKKLTELHDATFDLQSEAGAGTTVTITFPPSRCVAARGGIAMDITPNGRQVAGD